MGLKASQKYYLALTRLNSCPDPGRAHSKMSSPIVSEKTHGIEFEERHV
jgi:hypothetical protein